MVGRSHDDWLPAPRARAAIAKRLSSVASQMTTAALADMADKHPWYSRLDADHRSWITVVVRAGVDGFVHWFEQGAGTVPGHNIFDVAPRALQRQISLHQTVDLIRSTIETVEEQIDTLMPRGDRPILGTAIIRYSREIAFDAAVVYARAAEMRGAWDARLEALVMDAVVRGEADESVVARASTLGWRSPAGIAVVMGDLPEGSATVDDLRRIASRAGIDVLAAPQGERLVVLIGGDFTRDADALAATAKLADGFGPGPIVVGNVVAALTDAASSARAATSGRRSAPAWPGAPRPVLARDLLPERALVGDGHARRTLAHDIYGPIVAHSGDLALTLEAFLEEGTVEATARRLFIHANTVRYRLGRIGDLTGYSALEPRDAYALRLAVTLGRILGPSSTSS